MYFGAAIALLIVITIAVIILRFQWYRLSARTEKILLYGSVAAVAIRFIFLISSWGTASPIVNAAFCWVAVVGYQLMLVRFSLMRPRWLTSLSAAILLMPVFGSYLLFPLTGIFDTKPPDVTSIAKNYDVEKDPWDVQVNGAPGYDFAVFYRPSWIPFLRRFVQRSSFGEEQCISSAATVKVEREKKLVTFYCPGHHGEKDSITISLPLK
jgi:hypothetical protein